MYLPIAVLRWNNDRTQDSQRPRSSVMTVVMVSIRAGQCSDEILGRLVNTILSCGERFACEPRGHRQSYFTTAQLYSPEEQTSTDVRKRSWIGADSRWLVMGYNLVPGPASLRTGVLLPQTMQIRASEGVCPFPSTTCAPAMFKCIVTLEARFVIR